MFLFQNSSPPSLPEKLVTRQWGPQVSEFGFCCLPQVDWVLVSFPSQIGCFLISFLPQVGWFVFPSPLPSPPSFVAPGEGYFLFLCPVYNGTLTLPNPSCSRFVEYQNGVSHAVGFMMDFRREFPPYAVL